MPSIDAKLDLLARTRPRVRRAALLAAIHAASREDADPIVEAILRLHADSPEWVCVRAALARWPDLSRDARRALASATRDGLAGLLRDLADPDDGRARAAAIHVVADIADGRIPEPPDLLAAAVAVVDALTGQDLGDPATVDDLAAVAMEFRISPDARGLASSFDAALDRALAEAARRFDAHRSPALMDAMLSRVLRPGPHVRAWLDDDAEPGHLALRAAVRRLSHEDAARRGVALLAVAPLAGAAAERLERLPTPDLLLHAMLDAPLLMDRRRRAALRRVRRPESLLPPPEDLWAMPVRARLGSIRWIEALPLRPARRLELLGVVAADADPRVRLAVARAIAALPPSPDADEALAQLGADPEPSVATAAVAALARARSEHRLGAIAVLTAGLLRSPHAEVRHIVAQIAERAPKSGPDGRAIWTRPAATRRALLRNREQTIGDLRAQIVSADRPARLAAIGIATRLDLEDLVKDQLVAAARAHDPYVAAKAARALARIPDPGARRMLAELTDHADARVRADAVEALGASGGLDAIDLETFAAHPSPRVRANTLRAMLHAPRHREHARARLAEMLADDRAEHRRSALWLSQRCAVTDLADRIAHLVRDDPDEQIRARARRCARRLLAEMRRQWAHPAAHHAPGIVDDTEPASHTP